MPQLVIVEGPDMGRTYELSGVNRIGTAPSNDVLILDRRVSGTAVTITQRQDAFVLANTAESRHVMVNGEVRQGAILQHGDMISVAGTMMLFSEESPSEPDPDQDDSGTSPALAPTDDMLHSQILSRQAGFTDAQSIVEHFRVGQQDRDNRRLVTLYTIAQLINETQDLEHLLERLMAVIFEEFPADRGLILLANGAGEYTPQVCWDRETGRIAEPPPFSRAMLGEVIRTHEGIVSTTGGDPAGFLDGSSVIRAGIVSTMCVPLVHQSSLLGLLVLDSRNQAVSFDKSDLDQLSRIALQATLAIETILTFEEPKTISKNLRSLGRATQWLSSYLQRDEIIKETVTFACSLFQCKKASIMLLDPAAGALKLDHAIGLSRSHWDAVRVEPGEGLAGGVFVSGEPLLCPDPVTHAPPEGVVPTGRDRYQSSSFLIVPIQAKTSEIDQDTRVIGTINVTDKLDAMPFSRNDQELLTILAHQAGIALTNASLYEKATVDTLTRLYVRRYFFQRLGDLVRKARKEERALSLVMFDLDRFKRLNDSFGHPAGDAVLRDTGKVVKSVLRGKDIASRYGGEEFAVILPDTSLEVGEKIAERVREAIEGHAFCHDGQQHQVTVSVGLSELRGGEDGERLIGKADAALYEAKDGGRNRVCVYNEQ